ncbi:hypothetical protein NW767_012702 [Fusarium falciforme]|nr:hypothetical protein NW767_012702 [Fusarium falciforme]
MSSEAKHSMEKVGAETNHHEDLHVTKLAAGANESSFGFQQWKENLKSFKDHKRVSMWCLIALLLLVNLGFDGIISGQALAFLQFRKDYGKYYEPASDYVVDATWQSLWAAANTLGAIIGSFVSGFTNDRYGRKLAFWMHIATSIDSSFALVFAPNLQTLFAAKLIFGIAIGMAYTTAPLYVVENAPTEVRGALMSMFNTFVVFGQFLAVVVANPLSTVQGSWSYKGTFCLTFLIPAILLFIFPFMPESPVWYAMKGRNADARKAIVKLHNISDPQLVEEKMAEILSIIESSTQENQTEKDSSYLEIFKGGNLRRTLLMTTIYTLHHCSGMPFVLSYQAYFFQLSGVDNAFAITLGSFALMLAGNIGALILPEFVGQRNVMLYRSALLIIWDLVISGAGFAGTANKSAVMASVAFVASWAFFYQLTIGTIGFVVAPEMPTQRLRAKTQSFATIVANIVGWGIAFAIPYLFNPDRANLGARLLIIFVGLATPLTVYLWWALPETRNRTLEEVNAMFNKTSPDAEKQEADSA